MEDRKAWLMNLVSCSMPLLLLVLRLGGTRLALCLGSCVADVDGKGDLGVAIRTGVGVKDEEGISGVGRDGNKDGSVITVNVIGVGPI